MKSFLSIFLLLVSGAVWAIPVQWTLNNVAFDNGVMLTGSFTYDNDSDTYSDVLITASDRPFSYSDSPLPAFVIWNGLNPSSATNLSAYTVYDLLGWFELDLQFATGLTNSGGTVNILQTSSEADFGGTNHMLYPDVPPVYERFIVSGTVTAVPVPAAVWLFGSALAALGWMRRKKAY